MKILYCNIADLNVELDLKYDRTANQARAYEILKPEEIDFVVSIRDEIIEDKKDGELKYCSLDDIEYICSGSLFYRKLLQHGGLLLHSSAVVLDGYAYLFSADSGTGKSTHTGLWLEHFKDKAYILNDDKPAIRRKDGIWCAYGTPWSGKYDISVNQAVKLGGIVFLQRDPNNWIEQISPGEAIPKFIAQTTRRMYKVENMELMLNNLGQILEEVPVYKMGCNISDEAVVTAYEKIRMK